MSKKEEDERLWNFLIFKVFMTNQERDEMFSSPWLWVMMGIIFVMLAIITAIGGK